MVVRGRNKLGGEGVGEGWVISDYSDLVSKQNSLKQRFEIVTLLVFE